MSAFVLDCSVAVAWLFQDEATKETDLLLDKLKQDAAYLELAMRKGLDLATLDKALAQAARAFKVRTLPC